MPCPVRGRVLQPLYTMFELRNSQFNMFKHVLVKTTKLTMLAEWGLLGVRWHSDVAWCRYMQRTFTVPSRNILMPLAVEQVWTSVSHTQRKSPEVRLECIQTLGLSLVSSVRYDLFIVAAAWNKLEDVDGLPLITASTTRLPFIHVRSVGNQTAYSEDDHVNSVAPGTSSGWEEPKRTKRNCNAIIRKTHENIHEHHGKHGLPCKWRVMWVWQPLYTLFFLMNSEFGVFEHVLVKLLSFHARWMRFAKHIVTI